jgi:hypothetical protein
MPVAERCEERGAVAGSAAGISLRGFGIVLVVVAPTAGARRFVRADGAVPGPTRPAGDPARFAEEDGPR